MKREITVMGICAMALLVVIAYMHTGKVANTLVLIIEAGVIWSFVSAFRKA
jgi:hypothetical protein